MMLKYNKDILLLLYTNNMPPTYNLNNENNSTYLKKIYDNRFIVGLSTGILSSFIICRQNATKISYSNIDKIINNMSKIWKHREVLLKNIPLVIYFLENKLIKK